MEPTSFVNAGPGILSTKCHRWPNEWLQFGRKVAVFICPSTVRPSVNFSHFHHLLWNYRFNFDQTSHKANTLTSLIFVFSRTTLDSTKFGTKYPCFVPIPITQEYFVPSLVEIRPVRWRKCEMFTTVKTTTTANGHNQKNKKCLRNIYAPHGAKFRFIFSVEAKPVRSK